jgi:type VI secretion system protein ImpH
MAPEHGRAVRALIQSLLEEPQRFDFFQAVRLLERHPRRPGPQTARPPRPIGHDAAPREEAVRFRAYQSVAFPATSVQARRRGESTGEAERAGSENEVPQPTLEVNFLGLTGASGVLPQH